MKSRTIMPRLLTSSRQREYTKKLKQYIKELENKFNECKKSIKTMSRRSSIGSATTFIPQLSSKNKVKLAEKIAQLAEIKTMPGNTYNSKMRAMSNRNYKRMRSMNKKLTQMRATSNTYIYNPLRNKNSS